MLYSFRLIGPVAFCIDKLEDAEELKVWKTWFCFTKYLSCIGKMLSVAVIANAAVIWRLTSTPFYGNVFSTFEVECALSRGYTLKKCLIKVDDKISRDVMVMDHC